MRCPVCGHETRVLAMSPMPNGSLMLQRECLAPKPHELPVFDTVELLAGAATDIGYARLDKCVERAKRGIAARVEAARRKRIVRLLMGRQAVTSIAHFLGITGTRVYQLMKEIEDDHKAERAARHAGAAGRILRSAGEGGN